MKIKKIPQKFLICKIEDITDVDFKDDFHILQTARNIYCCDRGRKLQQGS